MSHVLAVEPSGMHSAVKGGLSEPLDMQKARVAIEAEHLTLRSTQATGYATVSARLRLAQVLAVCGPSNSGRSALLLTLTGRARSRDGDLRVLGRTMPGAASKIRLLTSVARIGESGGPDHAMSVEEAIAERAESDSISVEVGRTMVRQTLDILALPMYRAAMVGDLPALQQTWLAVALAMIRPAEIVVLDDLDQGLSESEQRRVWVGLAVVARSGPAVVASTAQSYPIEADIKVDLGLRTFEEIGSAFPRQKQSSLHR